MKAAKMAFTFSKPALTPPNGDICYVLDKLPPELRLQIYEYLVVANEPIRGRTSRGTRHYGLSLAILSVNKQINAEAKSLFYGKNTFYISSTPKTRTEDSVETQKGNERDVASSLILDRVDPPLPPSTFALLRHLTIDLIYYPTTATTSSTCFWKPNDPGCADYIASLIQLLQAVSPTLLSLSLTAEFRQEFRVRKCLISFYMLDRNYNFLSKLSALTLHSSNGMIPIGFEYPDCYYRTEVRKEVFEKKSLLLLACKVMFFQSQCKIDKLVAQFEEGKVKEMPPTERQDLGPLMMKSWGVGTTKVE
jgi:hypothetical protein